MQQPINVNTSKNAWVGSKKYISGYQNITKKMLEPIEDKWPTPDTGKPEFPKDRNVGIPGYKTDSEFALVLGVILGLVAGLIIGLSIQCFK